MFFTNERFKRAKNCKAQTHWGHSCLFNWRRDFAWIANFDVFEGHQSLKASTPSVSAATYNSVADLAHWFMFDFMPTIGFLFLVMDI